MIILDATTRKLQVILGDVVTTNQLPVVASYVDVTTTTYVPGSSNTASNSVTAVDVVAAPTASTQRQVKLLTVYNADTVAADVYVRYNDNGTTRIMGKATLAAGSTLVYTDGEGWRVITSNGEIKSAFSAHWGDITGTLSAQTDLQAALDAKVDNTRQVISGAGLTGGGDLSANRTLVVGAGTGITVNADDVALDTSSTRNTDHAGVALTAGAGLTGGGDISASRSFAVGAGTGITVNADDVAVNQGALKLDDFAAPDDNTDLNASTSAHGLVVKATAPASGLLSAVGIGNGETAYTMKPLFDTTNPAALGTAAPGTQVVAARRDHVHAKPSIASLGVVATLTDGATPALDASLGDTFVLVAAGNRTIAVPSNPTSGQKIVIRHNASGGARTLALNTGAGGFRFGTDITALTATSSGKTDYIGAIYNSTDSFWDVVAYVKGF